MAESALARLDAGRRERLAALGFELLQLRAPRDAAAPAPRARLIVRGAEPSRPLLRAVLAALGLREDEVDTQLQAGVPVLAFGVPVEQAVAAPAFDRLGTPAAKRALWPALRCLRRDLARRE